MPTISQYRLAFARVFRAVSDPGEDWDTIRAGVGTGTDTYHPLACIDIANSTSPNFEWLARGIVTFDLSFLSGINWADIYAAWIEWAGYDKRDDIGCAPDVALVDASPASYTEIAASDFQNVGDTLYSDEVVPYGTFLGANFQPLNAAGLGYLIGQIVSGYAAFGLREKTHDIEENNPGWQWNDADSRCRFYAGTHSWRPKLYVSYYSLPSVLTQQARDVTKTSATLRGYLAEDGDLPCQVRFQWGETEDYGNNTPWVSGTQGDWFEHHLSGFKPNTVYHFRAQARNSKGTVSGMDMTFDTTVYYNYAFGSIMWANWPRPGGVKKSVPTAGIEVVTLEDAVLSDVHYKSILYTHVTVRPSARGIGNNIAHRLVAERAI
jgi:hypothetical protein